MSEGPQRPKAFEEFLKETQVSSQELTPRAQLELTRPKDRSAAFASSKPRVREAQNAERRAEIRRIVTLGSQDSKNLNN